MITVRSNEHKRYLYGEADENFVKMEPRTPKDNPLATFKFHFNRQIQGKTDVKEFNKTEVSIIFKCSPDKLLNLCLKQLDKFPLPKVFEWTIEDICQWLRDIGFKQYQNTFRVNLITGRSLLLLDASALCAMNIKDFDHIKKISAEIRNLFYYEMTKFGRCLTVYPEFHEELYKLVRLKTGAKYNVRRSDVWRKMQLIRQSEPNYMHWDILEQWLNCDKQPPCKDLIGGVQRVSLNLCKVESFKPLPAEKQCDHCTCLPPCECFFSALNYRRPWHLKCLPHLKPDLEFVKVCEGCAPICNCHWSYKKYHNRTILTCLKETLPNKYGSLNSHVRYRKYEHMTRFSLLPQT